MITPRDARDQPCPRDRRSEARPPLRLLVAVAAGMLVGVMASIAHAQAPLGMPSDAAPPPASSSTDTTSPPNADDLSSAGEAEEEERHIPGEELMAAVLIVGLLAAGVMVYARRFGAPQDAASGKRTPGQDPSAS